MSMDGTELSAWIGRTETATDMAATGPLGRLAALLDHDRNIWPTGEVPPLAHWLYFLPHARQSAIDEDGHPRRGGLHPPVALPRRMWAGSQIDFIAPIPLDAAISRRSMVRSITPKTGKSGDMVFVTLRHEIFAHSKLAIIEDQDIVYRERATALPENALVPAAIAPICRDARNINPDPVLLFRFSALTFNGHRIHYDRAYARDVECYAGLVVHGPLIATLLMDHYLRAHAGRRIARFSFRAQRPLLDTSPFSLNCTLTNDRAELWAANPDGPVAMSAVIELEA